MAFVFCFFSGLACISVSVLNSRGGYIYIPCGKSACNYPGELDYFEQMTEVFLCEDEHQLGEYSAGFSLTLNRWFSSESYREIIFRQFQVLVCVRHFGFDRHEKISLLA